jgi:hypothetical protein
MFAYPTHTSKRGASDVPIRPSGVARKKFLWTLTKSAQNLSIAFVSNCLEN